MPERARYTPDRKGVAKLLQSPELRRVVTSIAERGARVAAAAMPRETGRLAASVHVEQREVTISGGKRVAAVIVAGAEYSPAVEFGNPSRGRGSHIMGSIADALTPTKRRV